MPLFPIRSAVGSQLNQGTRTQPATSLPSNRRFWLPQSAEPPGPSYLIVLQNLECDPQRLGSFHELDPWSAQLGSNFPSTMTFRFLTDELPSLRTFSKSFAIALHVRLDSI